MTIRITVQSPSCVTVRITQHWFWALLAYLAGAPSEAEYVAYFDGRRWHRVTHDGGLRRVPRSVESRIEHAIYLYESRIPWRERMVAHIRSVQS